VGENRSQSISEGALLKLGAADHGRFVNDGTSIPLSRLYTSLYVFRFILLASVTNC